MLLRDLEVLQARSVGKSDDHLQLRFNTGRGFGLKGIAFGRGPLARQITQGDKLDVVAEITINEWNGRTSAELMIRDLATAS